MYNICTIIYSLDQKAETTRTCQTSKGRTATHSLEMSTRYFTRQDIRYCSSKGRTAAHSIEMSTRYTTRQDMRYCSSKGRTAAHSIEMSTRYTTRQARDARCLPCSTTVHVSSH